MKTTLALVGLSSLIALPAGLHAGVVITPSAGFNITWDGNEGDHFSLPDPAPVPANLANAPGATAFASNDLGPELGITYHVTANLNDGAYGNNRSWIGGTFGGAPYAGVALNGLSFVNAFAFGRDNGNGTTDVGVGGQLTDRSLGVYTVQITRLASPGGATPDTGDASTGWQSIGTLNYASDDDLVLGGSFTSFFRHQFAVTEGGNPIQATGFRLLVPTTGLAGGTAIDEIEIIGSPVPEPTTALTALLGLGALATVRRRR